MIDFEATELEKKLMESMKDKPKEISIAMVLTLLKGIERAIEEKGEKRKNAVLEGTKESCARILLEIL